MYLLYAYNTTTGHCFYCKQLFHLLEIDEFTVTHEKTQIRLNCIIAEIKFYYCFWYFDRERERERDSSSLTTSSENQRKSIKHGSAAKSIRISLLRR